MLSIPEYKDAERLFSYFEAFSKIPHGSGNTRAIADFFVGFAKERGLDCYRDESDNVVIRKGATPGYEDRPTVIIQGHLDMVAVKKSGADIDMERDGLTLYRDGDFIRAKDTSLGGDDGVALMYAMALLDSKDIPHPAIEAVFTSDEEVGLLGATAIKPEAIKGRLLINVDSDAEGILTVGCAGGVRSDIAMPVSYEENRYPKAYRVRLYGFKGGHSGIEIDKGRANAIKVFAELHNCIFDMRIAEMSGGNADNAIPRECGAIICAGEDYPEKLKVMLEKRRGMLAVMPDVPFNELKEMDKNGKTLAELEPDVNIEICEVEPPKMALDEGSTEQLIALLVSLPSGVMAMSKALPDLVETSLNMGMFSLGERACVSFSVRSAVGEEKKRLCKRLHEIADKYNADYSERGAYPAWEYREDSHLRDVMVDVYKRMYGNSPKVVTIHAGLECGLFAEKLEGLDCVPIGPDNYDIHTTEERLSISSSVRVWEYIKEILKEI